MALSPSLVYVEPYGVAFPVHRFVLAARSDVFKSLFCGLNAEQKWEKLKARSKVVSSKEKGKGEEDGPPLLVNLRLFPARCLQICCTKCEYHCFCAILF
jgi:BTB/POZ domain